MSTNDECKLYCRVKDNTLYFLLKHKVKDGTPCNQDGFDKCVNGHCHQAGCDNILYSTAVLGEFLWSASVIVSMWTNPLSRARKY